MTVAFVLALVCSREGKTYSPCKAKRSRRSEAEHCERNLSLPLAFQIHGSDSIFRNSALKSTDVCFVKLSKVIEAFKQTRNLDDKQKFECQLSSCFSATVRLFPATNQSNELSGLTISVCLFIS